MGSNVEQRTVHCENADISYLLTRKPVKNVNLRIKPDGKILVSAGSHVPVKFIDGFIAEKQNSILEALARYEKKRDLAQDSPKRYEDGERYALLGRSLVLKVEESGEETVYTDGVYLFLDVKNKDNFRRKEILISRWFKQCQEEVFGELIEEKYAQLQKYGIPYPEWKVRNMKSRWGSCQTEKGVITLNSQLIAAPRTCIEYVVLHELVHFLYPNHSRQFWDFVAKMMPDWKERRKALKDVYEDF